MVCLTDAATLLASLKGHTDTVALLLDHGALLDVWNIPLRSDAPTSLLCVRGCGRQTILFPLQGRDVLQRRVPVHRLGGGRPQVSLRRCQQCVY